MTHVRKLVLLLLAAFMAGCATPSTLPSSPWSATIVTANFVRDGGDVRGIADTFSFERRIYVHAAFVGVVPEPNPNRSVRIKWFNGDRLIVDRTTETIFLRSPYFVWNSTSGTALGAGPCRVEIWVDETLAASKPFAVTGP